MAAHSSVPSHTAPSKRKAIVVAPAAAGGPSSSSSSAVSPSIPAATPAPSTSGTYKSYSSVASSKPPAAAPAPSSTAYKAPPAGPAGATGPSATSYVATSPGSMARPAANRPPAPAVAVAGQQQQQQQQQRQYPPPEPVQATTAPRPAPGSTYSPLEVKIFSAHGKRILCVAEIRGKLSKLNTLAKRFNASCIIHSGNFGFFDSESIDRISLKIIKQLCVFSPLLDTRQLPQDPEEIKKHISVDALSELPSFLNGSQRLEVPVYTIYGAAEDLSVLEKFKDGTYRVPNLFIIDEATTHVIKTPSGLNLRLFGLGGSFVSHRLFDHGDGALSIAGSPGVMWTTVLQMGQLISTVKKSFDPTEVRVFVTHPSPSREGLLAQLALSLRSDFTISSGLHYLYSSSFNETSALPSIEQFKSILASARTQFMELWDAVKSPLFSLVDDVQKQQLMLAYETFEAMPISATALSTIPAESASSSSSKSNPGLAGQPEPRSLDYLEVAFRNMWHFNLCDAEYGALVLNVVGGRVSSESYSEGFNFRYRFPQTNSGTATTAIVSVPQGGNSLNAPFPVTTENSIQPDPQHQLHAYNSSARPPRSILKNPAPVKSEPKAPPARGSPTSAPATTAPTSATTKPEQKQAASTVSGDASAETELPGVWIPSGVQSKSEVPEYFHEDDRKNIRLVVIKGSYLNRDKMFALVYFSTEDEAVKALERINREKAARASLIRQSSHPPSRSSSDYHGASLPSSTNGRSSHRGSGPSSSNGWGSTSGSSRGRGGTSSYRGRGGERGERGERSERGERERGERGERSERSERSERERGERSERGNGYRGRSSLNTGNDGPSSASTSGSGLSIAPSKSTEGSSAPSTKTTTSGPAGGATPATSGATPSAPPAAVANEA